MGLTKKKTLTKHCSGQAAECSVKRMSPMIFGAKNVESYFGYWPEFCDAKVERFSYDASGVINLTLHYIDSDLKKSASVSLRFSGITEINLNSLNTENVIDQLQINAGSKYTIIIESTFGLYGSFSCSKVEVVHVHTQQSLP